MNIFCCIATTIGDTENSRHLTQKSSADNCLFELYDGDSLWQRVEIFLASAQ